MEDTEINIMQDPTLGLFTVSIPKLISFEKKMFSHRSLRFQVDDIGALQQLYGQHPYDGTGKGAC